MEPKKPKYGLFKFTKSSINNEKKLDLKLSIFGDDDDSDEDSITPQYQSSNLKKQTQNKIKQAVEIDATIFQYDEVYDQIKAQREPPKMNSNNKPKYINNLLKAAETRKREQEVRLERKIQKEREMEGDEFKDKESFVTSSYREKLEEMRKTHEELENRDKMDRLLDVTKQNDLNGFYRSLYKNSLFEEKNITENSKIVFNKSSVRNKITLRERRDDNEVDEIIETEANSQVTTNEIKEKSESGSKEDEKKEAEYSPPIKETNLINQNEEVQDELIFKKEKNETLIQEAKPSRPKLTRAQLIEKLFTKRTVGEVFEEARRRYLERKSST